MLSGLLFYVRNLLFHVLLMFVFIWVCNLNLHGLCFLILRTWFGWRQWARWQVVDMTGAAIG